MKGSYRWKKKFLGNNFLIYRKNQKCGELTCKAFSYTCLASLDGKKFSFITKGIFKPTTNIIDIDIDKVIGIIEYGKWKSKAIIKYNDKEYSWTYNNFFSSRWSIKHNNRELAYYKNSFNNGFIESYTEDPLLLLSGLLIHNHFSQVLIAIFVGVFIPVIIANR